MVWSILADAVLLAHAAFIAWVALGAVAVAWRPWLAGLHLPALAWGIAISARGGTCPLTPLEVALRRRGGEAGYEGGFIEHYLTAAIYPEGLTAAHQAVLAVALAAFNVVVYAVVLTARRRRRAAAPPRGFG